MTIRVQFCFLFAVLSGSAAFGAQLSPDQLKFFEAKVRPILATNCHKCHSEAQGKIKGGLALDSRPGWEKGGDSGPALVPGDPEKSLLIKAIKYADEDTQMPPPQSGGQLKPEHIAVLEQWVKMGAPDPRDKPSAPMDIAKIASGLTEEMEEKKQTHWAYQPIKESALPTPKQKEWVKNEVDQFVLAKMEAKGLKPSAGADKRTLIRRAYFDLIGLPPSPDDVIAFVNDTSPDAFSKVVEKLLAMPQYGERWGRYWLDLARYADTRGEVKKDSTPLSPFAWTYRDYVIKAHNSDRPYDQFIKEQIAADLLPTAKTQPGTLAALGFITEGDQYDGNRQDIINDRIDVVTKAFLATTVSCARCHDHFFDPVTTRDYYSLHGIFNSCEEPRELPVIGRAEDEKMVADYEKDRKNMEARGYSMIDETMRELATKFNRSAPAFLAAMRQNAGGGKNFTNEQIKEMRQNGFLPEDLRFAQRAIVTQTRGMKPGKQNKADKAGKKESQSQMLDHPVLGIYTALFRVGPDKFAASWERVHKHAEEMVAAKTLNPLIWQAFQGKEPKNIQEVESIYGGVFSKAQEAYAKEFSEWKKSAPLYALFPGLRDAALEQVRSAVFSVKSYQNMPLEEMLRGLSNEDQRALGQVIKQLSAMDLTHEGARARANVVYDVKNPKDSPVFIRGEAQNIGPVVPRQFLEFLDKDRKPFPKEQSGRLQLAEKIASKDNPLTARVLVNRVWMHHFGEGFVNTPDDLGTMSEAPSHEELCNWLAAKFMEKGWSMKNLHRWIMNSATYQQTSDPNPEMAKIDPFNRLLWRFNVRRLDFESLRDSFLAIGGKIDLTQFGHPVNIETEPYSPRRSVYGFIDRLNMAEFLKNFDVANAQLPTGRRHQTVVPQQALFRMNSLLVIEQARNIIERKEFREAVGDESKIKALYEIIYQRWPKPEELKAAMEFIRGREAAGDDPATAPVGARSAEEEANALKMVKANKLLTADPKTLNPEQLQKRKELLRKIEQREKALAQKQNQKKGGGNLNELVRDPNAERVDRTPMDNWEKFAHALLLTNEVAYVN